MAMTEDTPDAELALDRARRGARVLIVTRSHRAARAAIERVSEALTPEDQPYVVRVTAGRMSVRSSTFAHAAGLPGYGEIRVVPATAYASLRGLTADTVLVEAGARHALGELQAILAGSPQPELLLQRDL